MGHTIVSVPCLRLLSRGDVMSVSPLISKINYGYHFDNYAKINETLWDYILVGEPSFNTVSSIQSLA